MTALALSKFRVAGRPRTEPESELERRLYACNRTIYRLVQDLRADQPPGEKKHSEGHIGDLVTGRRRATPDRSPMLAKIIAKIEQYEAEGKKKRKA
jgi:hypothetical protein